VVHRLSIKRALRDVSGSALADEINSTTTNSLSACCRRFDGEMIQQVYAQNGPTANSHLPRQEMTPTPPPHISHATFSSSIVAQGPRYLEDLADLEDIAGDGPKQRGTKRSSLRIRNAPNRPKITK
jgi:hypothetical protein